MFSNHGGAPAQQVPAWKRLGLKLKQPTASESADGTLAVGQPDSTQHQGQGQPSKRKFDAPPPAWESSPGFKRARTDGFPADRSPQPFTKKPKSVSFGDTPTKNGTQGPRADAGTRSLKPATPKKSKGPAKKQTPASTDIKPALEYLRQWKKSADGWKFNKNLQSMLIKHVFEPNGIPATDIDIFYDYIRDLKGFVRTRLAETAMETRTEDTNQGSTAFPEGTKDKDAKQKTYETLLSEMLSAQHLGQKRKGFNEAEYLTTSKETDKLIIQRVVKRMRAEMVLEQLLDGTDGGTSTEKKPSEASSPSETRIVAAASAAASAAENAMRPNEPSAKRRRKVRVSNLSDGSSSSSSSSDSDSSSGSSDSESDSDSDSSSSGSSSSGDSGENNGVRVTNGTGGDTSSSSDSESSSSGSESDSEDDSEDSEDE